VIRRLWRGLGLGRVAAVRGMRNLVALTLVALWPVMTSHALLEQWGVIHQVHADHDGGPGSHEHSDDHAFADGGYLRGSRTIQVVKAVSSAVFLPSALDGPEALMLPSLPGVRPFGAVPPGTAPPELARRWQFLLRAALAVRAPSSPA
jgi:hypothetical protein